MTASSTTVVAVYSIAPPAVVSSALEGDGRGVLHEKRRWATAARIWQDHQAAGQPYPLLLGDASQILGVEWLALVTAIDVTDQGTTVHFAGLRRLPRVLPLKTLHKLSDGQPLSDHYIRSYLPCWLHGAAARCVQEALAEPPDPEAERDALTVTAFAQALTAVQARLSDAQRAMLCGHAQAPDALLDMQAIAELGGYDNFRGANTQYAAVGRLLGEAAGLADLQGPTGVLGLGSPLRSARGHFQWVMREPLRQALRQLAWVPAEPAGTTAAWREQAVRDELAQDPQYRAASATTRLALVSARLGQGAYRARMLALWGGRCALTGCSLTQVLVASHAKPWHLSDNAERLDEHNGLLLAAHVDQLFDAGLISFDDDGHLLRKAEVSGEVLASLGLSPQARVTGLAARHLPYLRAHRDHFGLDECRAGALVRRAI